MFDRTNIIRIILCSIIIIIHYIFWFFNSNDLIYTSMIESIFDLIIIFIIVITSNMANTSLTIFSNKWRVENIVLIGLCISFFVESYEICKNDIICLVLKIPSSIMPLYDFFLIVLLTIPILSMIILEYKKNKSKKSKLSKFNFIHYINDFFKIILILLSFIINRIYYFWWLDYILSMLLIIMIVVSLIPNFIDSVNTLTDYKVDSSIEDEIKSIINGFDIDNFNIKESNSKIVIQFDLILNKNLTIEQANIIRMALETNINNSIDNSIININIK